MVRQPLSLVSLLTLLFVSLSSCASYFGTIAAKDAMKWMQESQPAADGSDISARWFWNSDDAAIDPARKAAADPANDIKTPWKDTEAAGPCQIATVNLSPVGVQSTWAQVKMAAVSVLSGNVDSIENPEGVEGGVVYLGSLAVVVYSPESRFATDLAAATSAPKGLTPASFTDHLGAVPATAPQPQDENPPTQPIGPPSINLAVPGPIPAGSVDCDSNQVCPTGEICHVVPNESGSSQGCVPATDALLGFAYDLVGNFCAGAPALCAMPKPPPAIPSPYLCGCNCTLAHNKCCTSDDGRLPKGAVPLSEIVRLSASSGTCCNEATGRFDIRPDGEKNYAESDGLNQRCDYSHEAPSFGLNGIGNIHTRRKRLVKSGTWD